jgi:hypothetical protein
MSPNTNIRNYVARRSHHRWILDCSSNDVTIENSALFWLRVRLAGDMVSLDSQSPKQAMAAPKAKLNLIRTSCIVIKQIPKLKNRDRLNLP